MLSLRPLTNVVESETPDALETLRPGAMPSLGRRKCMMAGLLLESTEAFGKVGSANGSEFDSRLLPGTILPLVNCVSRSTEKEPIVMARSSCLSGICRP